MVHNAVLINTCSCSKFCSKIYSFIFLKCFQDGRISYEEFAAMMKSGTDWRKASRQYSRERYNSLSLTLIRDGSVKVKD